MSMRMPQKTISQKDGGSEGALRNKAKLQRSE